MRTNRTFAANCAAILASARSNFGDACQTKTICGSTRRGLAGVALATTYYNPLMLTLDVGPSATLPTIRLATRRQSFGRLWPLVARLRNFSRLPKSVWSLGYCRLAFLTLSSSHFVKVFRCRPSQTSHTATGRRLKTSKERNSGKGHVLGGARALTMGIWAWASHS